MSARSFRVALNGYGRIGRCVLRALSERQGQSVLTLKSLRSMTLLIKPVLNT